MVYSSSAFLHSSLTVSLSFLRLPFPSILQSSLQSVSLQFFFSCVLSLPPHQPFFVSMVYSSFPFLHSSFTVSLSFLRPSLPVIPPIYPSSVSLPALLGVSLSLPRHPRLPFIPPHPFSVTGPTCTLTLCTPSYLTAPTHPPFPLYPFLFFPPPLPSSPPPSAAHCSP